MPFVAPKMAVSQFKPEEEFGSPSTLVKPAGLMQGDILKCLNADESDS